MMRRNYSSDEDEVIDRLMSWLSEDRPRWDYDWLLVKDVVLPQLRERGLKVVLDEE